MNDSIEVLLTKFLTNEANRDELLQLEKWIQDEENEALFLQYIKVNAAVNKTMNNYHNKQGVKEAIRRRILEEKRQTKNARYKLLKYAAVVAIAFGLGYLYHSINSKEGALVEEPIVANIQIKPGTDKATLTLNDGSQVALVKGQAYESDKVSSNGEEIVYDKMTGKTLGYNMLTVPRGGQFFVQLSDGTKVWLNSESQLKYPVSFVAGDTRRVELLYGEAYFDVAHSSLNNGTKFSVFNKNQMIEVLGTEFNIKAYDDDDIVETTLVEGKIKLQVDGISKELSPSYQAKLIKANKNLSLEKVDPSYTVSWRDGLFKFKNKSLKEVSKVLSRWYDVDFHFEGQEQENLKIRGVISKFKNIESLLLAIKGTHEISYEIKEGAVYIK